MINKLNFANSNSKNNVNKYVSQLCGNASFFSELIATICNMYVVRKVNFQLIVNPIQDDEAPEKCSVISPRYLQFNVTAS
ncbi:hypothetical protein [Pseudoalteromonas luteoviolacea]|uniref:Uncharacterized protein n=1 Tax=Pseudoalteromonas luteoviolacea S4054 TaxID=1129367 RepID=A0A0F6A7F4_9GAMM|nr:hypothetical protein [Pseudoalteromonas luteoviolacea]AOT09327.1 hypothetical protein S4054249_16385 [Pseudoalteromonas luteoviolacea]AOT14239.1 hypothetical protein S40542_16355 [Pseudoalteromonas luteoviolacea]AOT19155.1 hypothetical protein S4054_16360 [Pseudoalteromonas luteoviolacea]KKE82100.1 hypothetical protein N479_19895 [Pseudoalteromonas luteoviolacea S4054]KZN73432.1 hypothetical protein N481_11950 [Pseudoalteromonas luteoviolacea S4047-1]